MFLIAQLHIYITRNVDDENNLELKNKNGTEININKMSDFTHMREPDMTFFEPGKVNSVSKRLRYMGELVEESKRLHLAALRPLIGNATKVVWFEFASVTNRGDEAINIGQINIFSALGLQILFVCDYSRNLGDVQKARQIAGQHNKSDVIIMFSGGGNIGAWPGIDRIRLQEMDIFQDFKKIILPQSVYFFDENYLKKCAEKYSKYNDLTVLLRDERSYFLAKKVFLKADCYLVPDMAFHIGMVHRYTSPISNIRWIERNDKEKSGPYHGDLPDDLTIIRGDWVKLGVPLYDAVVDHTYSAVHSGFVFLQQGSVKIHIFLRLIICIDIDKKFCKTIFHPHQIST